MNDSLLGEGLAFPLDYDNGVLVLASGEDSVKAALTMLFSTRIGQRFMLPEYGTRIYDLLFEGLTDESLQLMQVYAEEEIQTWISRVQRADVTAQVVGDQQVNLRVELQLVNSPSTTIMVYPFYTEVGNG